MITFITIEKNNLPSVWLHAVNKFKLLSQLNALSIEQFFDHDKFKFHIYFTMVDKHTNWRPGPYLIESNMEGIQDIGLLIT